MSYAQNKPAFLQRFDAVWSKMRRAHVTHAVCWTLLAALCGCAALAAVDYWFEVGRSDRALGLGAVAALSLTLAVVWIGSAVRRWSRPSTAVEIEQRFPELGQAVRTSVQFGGRSDEEIGSEGVTASLVDALADHTEAQAAPLPIDTIVPSRRCWVAAAVVGSALLACLAAVIVNWEWRVAAMRAFLGDRPYTELEIAPGSTVIDQGQSVALSIAVQGRTRYGAELQTRRQGAEDWMTRELAAEDAVAQEPRRVQYQVRLDNINQPLEYRVVAGRAVSDTHTVDVRFPLAIENIQVRVSPPAYTGVQPQTVEEGNLNVIDGSTAEFQIQLDRAPQQAVMVLTETGRRLGPREKPRVTEVPLAIDGSSLTATLPLTEDQTYTVVAKASDGMQLPENKYRIRVRRDQPPQVWFEEPEEAIDVHALAEVLLRIRIRDDFGLARAGIKFQVNNEQEYVLEEKDYRALVEQIQQDGGRLNNQTRDALQMLLPLEVFNLTAKDNVLYYAFAEDNFPGGPHYTDTDLRFIDIRPFRRLFRRNEGMGGGGGGNRPELRSLGEIIARQRFNLNRTLRLARKTERDFEPSLVTVDRLARFEDDLAHSTRESAEAIDEVFDIDELEGRDLLFQAEEKMTLAVNSLDVGKYETSSLQQKDALSRLIEARQRIEVLLRGATDAQRAALASFDRVQTQKLRRERTDPEDEENPERLAQRLRRLAFEQQFVYSALTAAANPAVSSDASGGESDAGAQQTPAEDAEGRPQDGDDENPNAQDSQGEGDDEQGAAAAEPSAVPTAEPNDGGGNQQDGEPGDDQDSNGGDADMEPAPEEPAPEDVSREEIEQRQQNIADEARDIEDILNRIRNMSDLARSRSSAIADMTDQVGGALDRGNTDEALRLSRDSADMLNELAIHVQGIAAREAAQKIGMSRDLAGGLSYLQRSLAEASEQMDPEGAATDEEQPGAEPRGAGPGQDAQQDPEQRRAELARRARRMAETGRTLQDILDSVVETRSPGDSEAIREVDDVLGEGELIRTVERMGDIAGMLEGERFQDARVEAQFVADNLEAAARRLDEIFRLIVTPRVEQLMQLEGRAAELAESLNNLQTNQQITIWHNDAMELLDDLERANVAGQSSDELLEAMQKFGWDRRSQAARWDWQRDAGQQIYTAPQAYHRATRAIVEELQQQMQELILTDLVASEEEATPPKYRALVERYIQVLSSDLREKE